jgi:hypothetical protein
MASTAFYDDSFTFLGRINVSCVSRYMLFATLCRSRRQWGSAITRMHWNSFAAPMTSADVLNKGDKSVTYKEK